MTPPRYWRYLQTLRLIPDNIILAVAGRPITPNKGNLCICGWAVREALAKANHSAAEHKSSFGMKDEFGYDLQPDEASAKLFGGTEEEWTHLFVDIIPKPFSDDHLLVEEAFARRIEECV